MELIESLFTSNILSSIIATIFVAHFFILFLEDAICAFFLLCIKIAKKTCNEETFNSSLEIFLRSKSILWGTIVLTSVLGSFYSDDALLFVFFVVWYVGGFYFFVKMGGVLSRLLNVGTASDLFIDKYALCKDCVRLSKI